MTSELLLRIKSTLQSIPRDLLESGPLIVAVSGGPDSVFLLHSLRALSDELSLRLHVAHLHHGQRPEGDDDAEFVAHLAESLGCACSIAREDVPALARTERVSLEMAGRLARYRFFSRLAKEIGSKAVATGHHADDQAETVLLRAFRGGGTSGLRGIPLFAPLPESIGEAFVIRPLIFIFRAEIEAALRERGIETRLDSTNLDLTLQRNRIRREALPLAETISPGAKRGLLRIAKEAAEDDAILSEMAARAWEEIACERSEGRVVFRLDAMPAAPAILRRCLRLAIREIDPNEAGFPEEGIERLMDWMRDANPTASASFNLPGASRIRLEDGRLILETRISEEEPSPFDWIVQSRGSTDLPKLNLTIVIEEEDKPETLRFPSRDSWEAIADADALTEPLRIRSWMPGDRMSVFGNGVRRKLQDLFTEAGVPKAERRKSPILQDARRIAWVPGVMLSDEVKVTEGTRRIVRLRLFRTSD